MTCYTGTTGALEFTVDGGSAEKVAELTSWSITHTQETLDNTVMGNSYRSFCGGLKSWEGSCEVIWTSEQDSAHSVDEVFAIGSTGSITAYWDDNATPANDLKASGNCIITSIEYGVTTGELATATVNFQGTGALTIDATTAA